MTVFETVRQFFPARPRAPAVQVAESLPSVPEASTVEAAVKAIAKHGGPEVENLQFGGDLEAGGQGTVAAVTVTRCEDGGVMLPPRHLLHDAGKAVRRGKGKDADKVEAVMKLTKTKQVHRTWSMQYMLRALMLRALCSSYMPIMLFINVLWRVTATPAMLVAKVSDANVSDANASDAKVSDANASDANASDANASDANVSDANASDANASDANASDANASDANASDANASDANVSDAKVSDAKDSDAEQRIIVSTELSPRAHMTLAAFIARAADCVMPVLGEDWLVFWLASPGLPPSMVYWAMRAAVPLLMGGKVLWDSGVIHRDWKPSNVLVTLRFIGPFRRRLRRGHCEHRAQRCQGGGAAPGARGHAVRRRVSLQPPAGGHQHGAASQALALCGAGVCCVHQRQQPRRAATPPTRHNAACSSWRHGQRGCCWEQAAAGSSGRCCYCYSSAAGRPGRLRCWR